MFEHGPFKPCPNCAAPDTLGILSVAGQRLRRRCAKCRHTIVEPLPTLNKTVIYLDQLALSEMFKAKAGLMNAAAPHKAFWEECAAVIERLLLLQQAVFPASNIHLSETIPFRHGDALRRAYEAIGGGVAFQDTMSIEHRQVIRFAEAFLAGGDPPALSFDIDDILMGPRNVWLPTLRVGVNADYSHIADEVRAAREASADTMKEIAERWQREKPSFEQAVAAEINQYGPAHKQARQRALMRVLEGGGFAAMMDAALGQANVLYVHLKEFFRRQGVAEADIEARIGAFLDWNGLAELPVHRIGVYMFAGLARKMAAGQKRLPSRGMLNDVNVIACYAPYVDAMFVDNECANLLREEPLRSELRYRAQIFSLNSGADFLAYLRAMEAAAPDEVKAIAAEIYGVASIS